MKVTQWFDGDVKPVHIGVYEREDEYEQTFQKWNGKHWCFCAYTTEIAAKQNELSGIQTDYRWRGVVKPKSK